MKTVGIVAFAFGVPFTIRSNRQIAHIASKKARELNAPVYTQLDVHIEQGIEVEQTDERPGSPPSTLCMARGAVSWAKQKKLTELWIVAAKPHLWRVVRDTKMAVREAGEKIEVHDCSEINQYSEDLWFCPESEQIRAQSRERWLKREVVLKLIPFCIYKRIAK